MAQLAFDLAEQLQTPVFVMSDLDLGMNNWMADPFPYPTEPLRRGKVLDAAAIEKVKDSWGRYKDVDGDGIPYRTLPGTPNAYAAYFTRGSGHDERAQYSEKPQDYVNNVNRLLKKFETARTMVPKPEFQERPGARAGLLAYGTSHYGTTEARDKLATTFGVPLDYCRLKSLPLSAEAVNWLRRHDRIYVVEQNRDGQLVTILRDELPELATRFVSIRQYNGLPLDATTVVDGVLNDAPASRAGRSDANKGGIDA
jgi:2-oxoglutarate ferredoxin oxidoreductase subunit alpha